MNQRLSIVLGVLALGSIVVAGYVVLIHEGPQARIPDDPAHAVTFACERCGHAFALTPTALSTALESREPRPGNWLGTEPLMVQCPKCGQFTARRPGCRRDGFRLTPGTRTSGP